jgi:hypothetical protein
MVQSARLTAIKQFTATRAFVWLALIALTLFALALRSWGLSFGLPYAYHIDEHFYYPNAWAMGLGQLDLPDQSHGPSLYLGVLLIGQRLMYALLGQGLSLAEFGRWLETNPWPFLLSARVISALAGALTIPFVFLMGRRYRDRRIGLSAALIMSVLFFHVRDSHFGVPDSFMTLFVAMTGWLALRAYQSNSKRDFWLAGLAAGLATASKYTSAIVFVPVALAAFHLASSNRKRTLLQLTWAIIGLVIGFAIGYPNLLINFPAFIKDISFLWIRVGAGFEGWSLLPDNSAIFYLSTLLWSIGLAAVGLSAIGLLISLRRRHFEDWLLVSFPIVYVIVMSLSLGHFGRYMIPILPCLAVLIAETCLTAVPHLIKKILIRLKRESIAARRLPGALGVLALLSVIVPNAANSLRADWILAQPDTRSLAKAWIETNLPAGARIAVEWPYHTPPLSNGYDVPPGSQREYWIDLVWGFGLADRPITQYQTDGTQYLISTSYIYDIPVADPQQQLARQKFYAELPHVFREIKTFSPRCDGGEPEFIFDQIYGPAVDLWRLCYAGPLIRIYQVPPG